MVVTIQLKIEIEGVELDGFLSALRQAIAVLEIPNGGGPFRLGEQGIVVKDVSPGWEK